MAATLRRRAVRTEPGAGAADAKAVTLADRGAGGGARPGKTVPAWRGTRCQTELAESQAVSGDRTRPPQATAPKAVRATSPPTREVSDGPGT